MSAETLKKAEESHKNWEKAAQEAHDLANAINEPQKNDAVGIDLKQDLLRLEVVKIRAQMLREDYESEWGRHQQELHEENVKASDKVASRVLLATAVIAGATLFYTGTFIYWVFCIANK